MRTRILIWIIATIDFRHRARLRQGYPGRVPVD